MNNKKKSILAIICVVILVFALYMILKPRSYNKEYKVKDYLIKESYDTKYSAYVFKVTHEKREYTFVSNTPKKLSRKLIGDVEIYSYDEVSCMKLKSNKLDLYPVCYKNDELVSYNLVKRRDEFFKAKTPESQKFKYEKFDIKNLGEKKYLIWGTKGYYYITESEQKELFFLDKETYLNNLSYMTSKFVITPDYDQEYAFNKFYIINIANGKLDEWKLDFEISYDSYFLGSIDNKIYLFDRKNRKEYEIEPRKKKIEIINRGDESKIWNDGWSNIPTVKLTTDDYTFDIKDLYQYKLDKNKLFMYILDNSKTTRLSENNVDTIVKKDKENVYYLVKDKLFVHNMSYGEAELISYSEWQFNNKNAIFIY